MCNYQLGDNVDYKLLLGINTNDQKLILWLCLRLMNSELFTFERISIQNEFVMQEIQYAEHLFVNE